MRVFPHIALLCVILWGALTAGSTARADALSCSEAFALAHRLGESASTARLLQAACGAGSEAARTPSASSRPPRERLDSRDFGPIHANHPEVDRWVSVFLGPAAAKFDAWLAAGEPYRTLVERELRTEGAPVELLYLALVESGFNPKARSRAGAVGLWQLMPATARQLGLRVDAHRDDRTDPVASTRAGVKYLRQMAERFGSWHLAMAAYNCGPGCVGKAIDQSSGTRDYWSLCARGALPQETRDYVPKIIAAARIGQGRAASRRSGGAE
jgi:membrane-bound lytic murein transglycosylase D